MAIQDRSEIASPLAKESGGNLDQVPDLLRLILIELGTISYFVKAGLNVPDEVEEIRAEQERKLKLSSAL